jgi:hypothetical protein
MRAITSIFGKPRVDCMAPTWRLKLGKSNLSKSAMWKEPTPRRTRVIKCTPPTPPAPAMATRLPRRLACSASVTQPILRAKAWL